MIPRRKVSSRGGGEEGEGGRARFFSYPRVTGEVGRLLALRGRD